MDFKCVHEHQDQFESDSETHVPQTSNQTLNVNSSIDRQNTENRLSNIDQSSSEKESGVIDLNFEQVISSDEVISMGSDGESTDIMEPLRNWVNTYEIKANAVDSLLKLLKQNGHPNIPICSRTLLKTPREVDIIKVSNMDYFYFGLETLINNALKKYN